MWFKNLFLYQFEKEFDQDADSLHDALSQKPFINCSATQRESMGWIPPLGKKSEAFSHSVDTHILLTMARQERLLPASVIREELQERIIEIQERESRKVGSKEKKELTERIEDELLPKAFTRTQKLDAWIDLRSGWLVINTSSSTRAEAFATLLRKTIGSLPAVPPKSDAVSPVLTEWLSKFKLPDPFEIGDECEMQGLGDDEGIASFRKHELSTDEVKSNIEAGKTVSKLALIWDRKISFVISEDLVVKKLKFLGVLEEKMNEEDPQSHEERVDIEFALMTGELSKMITDLNKQFNSE